MIDGPTPRSSSASGTRGGYGGAKREKGSKLHVAADALGNLPAPRVTAANADDRAVAGRLVEAARDVAGDHVETVFTDQGHAGDAAAEAA